MGKWCSMGVSNESVYLCHEKHLQQSRCTYYLRFPCNNSSFIFRLHLPLTIPCQPKVKKSSFHNISAGWWMKRAHVQAQSDTSYYSSFSLHTFASGDTRNYIFFIQYEKKATLSPSASIHSTSEMKTGQEGGRERQRSFAPDICSSEDGTCARKIFINQSL